MNEMNELLDLKETSVDSLLKKARIMKQNSRDFTISKANTENCMFDRRHGALHFIPDDGGIQKMHMSRYAFGQLCGKIGVPANYIEKCINTGRLDLAVDNVNSWLDGYNKNLFVRSYESNPEFNLNDSSYNGIRGILSTRYSVCDSDEILECIDSVLNLNKFNVKGSYLTPERFHLRVALKEKMNVVGEDLFAGLSIDSSDVGRSTLQVRFLVFKQVCTNGLIVSKSSNNLFKQKHIGITSEEFAEGLESSVELFPDLIKGVEDMIINAITTQTYKFKGITDEEFDDLVKRIVKETPVSDEEAKKVISIMQSDRYSYNKWGYINALTDVAKELTLEKRLEVEEYAGSLLVA